ncbi:MAG: hypothetical protein M4D80_20635 [Myxococcota bacterium]|nr:hypothetical protein [Deltaproteobacteria bacterium]MDQ3337576.1 hypothetical protein [Myxococcota bacterium]
MSLRAALLIALVACNSGKSSSGGGSGSAPEPPKPVAIDAVAPVDPPDEVDAMAPVVRGAEPTRDAINKLKKEPTGGIVLGMTAAELVKVLGKPASSGQAKRVEDALEATYTWPGVKAVFRSTTSVETVLLNRVTFSAPSKAKTARGIGVGSTRAEVYKAYADIADPTFAEDPRFFVAGLSAGHLGINGITFNFPRDSDVGEKAPTDKVTSIELSGGAED